MKKNLKKSKPFKGSIEIQEKRDVSKILEEFKGIYPSNLGYYYYVRFIDHPTFGTTTKLSGAHTSLVVREYEENGEKFVETLNSIYKVV